MKFYLLPIITFLWFCPSLQAQKDFFDLEQIQEIRLQVEADNWRYLLDSLRVNGDDMLTAKASINGKTYDDVGLRYQQFVAFTPGEKHNPLFIQLDYKKEKQAYEGRSKIHLSHAFRDPSMLREVLSYQIIGTYMAAPKANFAKVFINDKFYALLVNTEPIDEDFLTKHYGSSAGDLFKSEPQMGVKNTEGCKNNNFASLQYDQSLICYQDQFIGEGGWQELQSLTRILEASPNQVQKALVVDDALWMLALNNVLVNLHSYTGLGSQNYRLYREEYGIFHTLHGDMNLAFGSFKNTGEGSDLSVMELQKLDPMLHAYSEQKPLISQLLKNDHYRKIYISHMRTILEDFFWNEKFEQEATALHHRIKPILEEHNYETARFDSSLNSITGKLSRIPGIVDLMNNRAAFLKKHPIMTVLPSNVEKIELKKRAAFSSDKVEAFEFQATIDRFPKEVTLFYRFDDSQSFQEVNMTDDGKSGDVTADDGIFGVKVTPKGTKIEYYIFVENSGAVSYEPSEYRMRRHTASLSELNK